MSCLNLDSKTIFQLKSNTQTYVELFNDKPKLYKIFWCDSMERGYNSSWMISSQHEDNLIPILGEEKEKILNKREKFEKNRKEFEKNR